jgi:hypothetical protein
MVGTLKASGRTLTHFETRTQAQRSTPKVPVAFCSLDSGQPASSSGVRQPQGEWLAVSLPGLALAHLLARVHGGQSV